ncbi:MAG: penicillin-binding protein [Clostridiales Family XIII bacterium]|jgi:peptidoglycan glycosyltransferase|nr:penicillin-binding protein [Clostridiales Family XIII bacterium]
MKLMSKRAGILFTLCILFAAGMMFLLFSYVKDAPKWATSPVNQHLYKGGELVRAGQILDAKGVMLASTVENERVYNPDENTRVALMHLVGDPAQGVGTALQVTYRSKLVGWDYLNGTYHFGNKIGNNIRTTVDADLARAAYAALGGRRGTVGVMNYKTGELLCMVSAPSFDPAAPPDIESDPEKYDGVYINRLLSATYTPGSIFKLVTAAAAIDNIPGIGSREFVCEGSYDLLGTEITCPAVHGRQSFEETMVNSCNIAYAQMAAELGPETMTAYAEKAGVMKSPELDGIGVANGHFSLNNATPGEIGWAGVGQSDTLVNPLSYLGYVAAIAGGGDAVKPHIIKSIRTPNGFPARFELDLPVDESILAQGTAGKLQQMMRADVVNGYGEGNLAGYGLSAKSGTAEVTDGKEPHSWFCGFLDSETAPLAFIVIVENGGAGSSAAATVARTVLEAAVGA